MALTVVRQIGDRFDDRLLALARNTFASASDSALTWWSEDGDTTTLVSEQSVPGPLSLLPNGALGWGPTVIRERSMSWPVDALLAAAIADLGPAARGRFVPVAGAVDAGGERVLLVVRRQLPRTEVSRTPEVPGPPVRIVVLDNRDLGVLCSVDATETPQTASWGGGLLLVGSVAAVKVFDDASLVSTTYALPGRTAVRAIAWGDHVGAAGLAEGSLAAWSGLPVSPRSWAAHDGVVRSLAWSPGTERLASGGDDGQLRIWERGGGALAEIALGGSVTAVCWLDERRLVAKVGDQAGALLVLES